MSTRLFDRFPERRVAVTGAASGLGRCFALQLAGLGWKVALSDVNEPALAETATLVREAGGEPLPLRCDVTRPEDLEALAAAVRDAWGGVDVLINNAGVAAAGPIDQLPLDVWDFALAVNLPGAVHGCRSFVPMLAAQGAGHIINVASMAGMAMVPEMSAYNCSKAAVIALSETLRSELAPKGIGVTVGVPMFFQTNLLTSLRYTDEAQKKTAAALMARAKVTAADVAHRILRGADRNRLYVMTESQGRATWRLRRWTPRFYFWLITRLYRRGEFDLSGEG